MERDGRRSRSNEEIYGWDDGETREVGEGGRAVSYGGEWGGYCMNVGEEKRLSGIRENH